MNFHIPKKPMSGAKRKRAQENWRKLRMHIKEMRNKPNYLFQFLDEVNDEKHEFGMFG